MAESAAPVGGRVVEPDGSIHYDFDGHVRARGVDLTAAPTFSTPESLPVDSVVDWVQADGGVAARIWGRTGGVLRLAGDSEVRARAELGGGLAIERTIIRDDGYSDFAENGDLAAAVADQVVSAGGAEISGQYVADYALPAGGFTHVDIDTDRPLGSFYLPLYALLDSGGATDRTNFPCYTEAGPSKLRFTLSTAYGFPVDGVLICHVLHIA